MKFTIISIIAIVATFGCSRTPPPESQNINTVTICSQIWMTKNLDVSTYRNGDTIPEVTDPTEWQNLTTGAWCYYDNDSVNGPIYGKLYNWYAMNDPRGLAPTGYHVPSDAEWTLLENCLGGDTIAGGKMKEMGVIHWINPNIEATNSSGFTGLPGGGRSYDGPFYDIGGSASWWNTNGDVTMNPWGRLLVYYDGFIGSLIDANKNFGFYVRCLRN